jgi:serralysin
LKEGELLILDVDGTTGGLDALVRVFGPGGVELTSNDDTGFLDPGSQNSSYGHNTDSLVRFRAPSSGTYTFSVASFVDDEGGATSGAYKLNVSIGPAASMAEIHEENIDALLSGAEWGTSTVSYGFTTSASQYGANEGVEEKGTGFEALNSTQRQVVRTGLGLVSGYTNLALTENTGSPGSAQMRYAMSDNPGTAHAYYPGSGDGGDSWYNNNGPTWDGTDYPPQYDSPKAGNYAYATFLHESGHALGLKHGHETPPLNYAQDSMEYSIMTYRSYVGASTGDDGGYTNESWGYAQTFMMYDIAALQRMYGADFTTNSGATVYSWNASTGAFMINGTVQWTPGGNRVFMTIWDGGGTDTYDLSNYGGGVTIDLRPGEWSKTSAVQLANLGDGHDARGNVANALLYNNDGRSLIENAVGGSGGDVLVANQAVNNLKGNGGADRFDFNALSDSGKGSLADKLGDFLSGTDKIDLSGIDASSKSSGNQAFSFIGTNGFSGVAGQLRYQSENGGTRVFADVDGDKVSDFELIVSAPSLQSIDFIV